MGKGDKRSRRGKIAVGSFGKTRPKKKKPTVIVVPEKPAPAKKRAKKPAASE